MKKLITIILLFISLICSATNYYVKNSGSDAANGLTDGTAWQTINKVNTSSFSAGDTIFFNKGDTWRETLTVPSSGSVGSYIVFSSYGTGNDPKILGSDEITTWIDTEISGVAASNDLLAESFEGAGYENLWTETALGANESNLIDEDNTDVARPSGGGLQILKIVKDITPTGTAAASAAKIRYILAEDEPITYIDFYVMINAHGLSSGDLMTIFHAQDASYGNTQSLTIGNYSGTIRFLTQTYTNGDDISTYYPESGSLTLDQWYRIQLKYDVTNHSYSILIDGHALQTGTLTGTHRSGVTYLRIGDDLIVKTLTAYFDLVNVSSTNFYLETVPLQTNRWASDNILTDPYSLTWDGNIYFKETNGDITWGTVKKADTSSLDANYNWTWLADRIIIYSSTDPNSRYSGVEASQRVDGIALNDKEYLTFDGLEIAYSGSNGIGEQWPDTDITGLIVKNCHIHHIGIKASLAGYGLSLWHSDMLIQNNTIHDCGRRGLSLNLSTGAAQVSNIVVEDNTFYHGFHTTGVDIEPYDGSIDSVIIRRNLIYDDITESLDGVESYQSNGMYIAEEQVSGELTKIYVYDNIIRNCTNQSINIQSVTSSYVYNNTIYGVNPNLTEVGVPMVGLGGSTSCVFKNNIIYNNAINTINNRCFDSNVTGTVTSDYNLFYCTDASSKVTAWLGTSYTTAQWATYKTASGQDANSPAPADPLFYSSSDYRLQLASPALYAGVNLGLGTDYAERAWNDPPSLGALEYPSTNLILLRDSNGKLLRTSGNKLIRQWKD